MTFINGYEHQSRADAHASLEFANTYYLAYRDLPAIISEYVVGTTGLDFGCGTGGSSGFLQSLGFKVIGVDVSEDMLPEGRSNSTANMRGVMPVGDGPHTYHGHWTKRFFRGKIESKATFPGTTQAI